MKLTSFVAALCIVIMIISLGCTTNKILTATGGSRSDGTVKLSFEYGIFESPKVDEQQGLNIAKQRCAVWGYNDAEAFGGMTRTCNVFGSSGCTGWIVTYEYQCTTGRYSAVLNRNLEPPIYTNNSAGSQNNGNSSITFSGKPVQEKSPNSSQGIMAYEAEAKAMNYGCIGSNGGRPGSNLIGLENNMERYQITCFNGILYIRCESRMSGLCVKE